MFCLVSDARKILKYKYDTFMFQSSWVLEVWQCLFSSHHRRKTRPVRNARQRHCATGKSSSQWSEQWFPAAKFHPSSNAHCEDGLGNCHVVSYGNSQCLTSPFPPVLLSISWFFNHEKSENNSHLVKTKPLMISKSLTICFPLFLKHNRGWFKLLFRSSGSHECRHISLITLQTK